MIVKKTQNENNARDEWIYKNKKAALANNAADYHSTTKNQIKLLQLLFWKVCSSDCRLYFYG